MLAPQRGLAMILALALAAGCAGPAPTSPASPSRPKPKGTGTGTEEPAATTPGPTATTPGPTTSPVVVATPTGLSTPALPPLDLSTATLVGKVKAPGQLLANNGAGLLSDHGGGIIANNGGGLIGNNSGGYRLTQAVPPPGPEQFFVAGAKVELLDAAGKPLNGPDGQPLVTTALPDGTYFFKAALPTRHFIVRATPPGSAGGLSRLVAGGVKAADVDLSSALVASYVLDQYVAGQPDPQATLDKLPAKVEAETVALALGALTPAGFPASLDAAALVTATTGLRKANAAFDGQMEVVKRILIAAGVSNLGVGLAATDVYFRRIFATEAAADGTLYLHCDDDKLIYRVGPDGKLAAAAGTGQASTTADAASRAGLKADAVNLGYVMVMQVDDLGRLVVSEDGHGVWRREADGTITELHSMAQLKAAFGDNVLARGACVRNDGTLVILNADAIWALPVGGTKQKLADAPNVRASMGLTELPGRQAWVARFFETTVRVQAGGAPEAIFAANDPRLVNAGGVYAYPSVDARGNVFYHAASDRQIHRLRPDGADDVVLDPATLRFGVSAMREGLDGKLYVTDCNLGDNLGAGLVRRVDAGVATPVAGLDGLPKGFTADGRVPLLYPKGLDVAPDGTLFIADGGALLSIPPGGAATALAPKDYALASPADRIQFTGVRRLASGKLAARALGTNRELIVRQTDAGWEAGIVQAENFGNPWNIAMHAWDAAPDGTLVASVHSAPPTGFPYLAKVLIRRPGAAAAEELVPESAGFTEIAKLTFAPDGTLWMRAIKGGLGGKPGRYTIALATGAVSEAPAGALAAEAADAAGNLYEGDAPTFSLGNYGDRHIRRAQPGAAATVLAGPGAALLGGTGLDDSIGWAEDLRFDQAGNLYVRDVLRRQVRRIPKERL